MVNSPMPDITPVQILAFLTWVGGQAIAYGWLDTVPSQVTLSAVATVIAAGLAWVDGYLRKSRNERAARETAALAAATKPPSA